MWPFERSRDDISCHSWDRQYSTSFSSTQSAFNRPVRPNSATARFGSQPVLRHYDIPEYSDIPDIRSESDSVSLFIDSLCLQNSQDLRLELPYPQFNNQINDFPNWDQNHFKDQNILYNGSIFDGDHVTQLSDYFSNNYDEMDNSSQYHDLDQRRNTRSAPSSPIPFRRKHKHHTNWSYLAPSEQMKVVENLTKIVNTEMDMFEQLEIIRILKPDTKLGEIDDQFIVEPSMLDNSKYRYIRDLLQLQGISIYPSPDEESTEVQSINQSNVKMINKQDIRISRQRRFLKLRQRKDKLQQKREERSGLFEYNEIVSVKRHPQDEENDIDILS